LAGFPNNGGNIFLGVGSKVVNNLGAFYYFFYPTFSVYVCVCGFDPPNICVKIGFFY
jgi:hypothetical protein